MKKHGPRHKYVPHIRMTCAVCGRPNVAHTISGEPFRVHRETKGHQDALARSVDELAELLGPEVERQGGGS